MDFGGLRFVEPLWLVPLPLAWILCWRLARAQPGRSAWGRVCDARLLELLGVSGGGADAARWLAWTLALLLSLGLLAAAGPGWRPADEPPLHSAAARVIALDLSRAMLVQDVKPSRYAHARAAASEVIDAGFDGETGLLVYAGAVFTVAPLTRDAGTLRAFLDALEPGILPLDGARVDLAIERAAELLAASISGRGQILLLSSGVDDRPAALAAARRARAAGQRVSLMAFGSAAGGPRIAPDGSLERDEQGAYRLAKTDADALAGIAAAGGGRFSSIAAAARGEWMLDTALDAHTLVEADQAPEDRSRGPANEGYWLVWLMLAPFLLLFRRNLLYLLPLAILVPPLPEAAAADWSDPWRHAEQLAWRAWRDGEYRRAAELSSAALLRGAAHYREGSLQQALRDFGELDSAAAHFNRGNTLVRLKLYVEALAAYELALQRQPAHRAARYNLRLVKLFLERQRESSGQDPRDPGAADPASDPPRDDSAAGAALQPLDSPDAAPAVDGGDGASMPTGLYNPLEAYSGRESPPAQPAPGDFAANAAQDEVQAWIAALPASATELFKRKFLRDYRRAQQGDR